MSSASLARQNYCAAYIAAQVTPETEQQEILFAAFCRVARFVQ